MSLAKSEWAVSRSEYRVNGIRMIPTEEEEQKTVISWCRLHEARWPELGLIHHIPNGGKRSKSEAAGFKAMGVLAGVPDLFLPVPRAGFHGMYVELKALDGTVSKNQKEFLTAVIEQGYFGCVCWGAEDAIDVICRYMREGTGLAEIVEGVKGF